MSVIEREVRILRTKSGAEHAARILGADAFPGQTYEVRPAALDPGRFAVVLVDGDVADTAPMLSYRGGRGVEREDPFAIGAGRRSHRKARGQGRVFS